MKNAKDKRKFVPRLWLNADRRLAIVRRIKAQVDLLQQHANADSFQKQLLCQRAVFLALQLETAEREALETGKLDMGVYTQGCNALSGLLTKLGLSKQSAAVDKLRVHLAKHKRA